MLPIDDLYAILGVAATADHYEIRRRYRQLVKETHPDVLPSGGSASGEPFLEIRRAYEVLSDARRRAQYDVERAAAAASAGARRTPSAEEYTARDGDWDDATATAGGLGDFVRQFFGGPWAAGGVFGEAPGYAVPPGRGGRPGRGPAPQRTDDPGTPADLTLTLKDAFFGRELEVRGLRVRIPPGARHGARFKLPPPVGEVRTLIQPEAGFRVNGDDIETEVYLDPRIFARGGEVGVQHPAGQFKVAVPNGFRDGQLLRLRGRGLPATPTRRAGDLLLRVRFI